MRRHCRCCNTNPSNTNKNRRWVFKALDAFVSGLDLEADGVAEAVFGFCLDNISAKRVGASVKATLLDKVCLPMVRRCPVEISRNLFRSSSAGAKFRPAPAAFKGAAVAATAVAAAEDCSVLARLLAVVQRRTKAGAFMDGPLLASCCFALIEALYDMFDLEPLQALAEEALGGGEKTDGGAKKQPALRAVTLGIVTAWKAIGGGGGAAAADKMFDRDWRALRCRRAAFSCLCMAVSRTQDEEKLFDKLLWVDPLFEKPLPPEVAAATAAAAGGGSKTSVLALVLDMEKEHEFEVSPPSFPTTRLRSARPPPLGGRGRWGPGASVAERRRRRGGVTASSMLSQSSLGFGGDSLAVAAAAAGGGESGGDGGVDQGPSAEDARETYSSQAALAEPDGEAPEGDGAAGEQSESQSQGDMAPMFGMGAGVMRNFGGGDEEAEDGARVDGGEDEVVLEMSHVNKEPCMRSLLLVVQTEERLFGDGWKDKAEKSNGV